MYQSNGNKAEQRQEWDHGTAAIRVSADPLGRFAVGEVKSRQEVRSSALPATHWVQTVAGEEG